MLYFSKYFKSTLKLLPCVRVAYTKAHFELGVCVMVKAHTVHQDIDMLHVASLHTKKYLSKVMKFQLGKLHSCTYQIQ